MQKNKAKILFYIIMGFMCTLIIGGLAFAVPNMFASAAILPDRFDPDRFTSVTFPELKEPDAQKYYGNGYFVVQDMVFKTLGYADSETSGIYNTIYNNRVDKTGSGIGNDASYYTIGSTTTEFNLDGYQIIMEGGSSVVTRSNQIQYLKFTLAKEGKISFTYKVSSEATYDHFYLVVDGILDLEKSGEVVGTYEKTLSAGVHEVAFAYMRDNGTRVGSDSVLITNLEFGEGPQGGIYKDSGLEWAAEKGNKIVEENLELICDAYQEAGGYYPWVLDNGGYYKTFPMSITGNAGAYILTSAEMLCEDYENSNYNYDALPICLVEIPFTLSSAQTISFNYELYSEDNYDFLLVFIDNIYVFGLSGEYTDSFTSSTLSAGNHTIMFAVVKDGSVDRWYDNGYPFEAQITNLNITSSVDVSKLMPQANKQSYSYKGKISAITNYDIYDVFASCYHTEGDPAQNVYDTTGINYGGEAGIYSDANATNFVNTSGYYFKTIHEAANYFNSIQTASTTFNMVILDDIEVESEATFNNANVSTFNIYTDDNETLRTETNPYILENTKGGSILDIESSGASFNNANPIKFIAPNTYSLKFNERGENDYKWVYLYGHLIFESNHSDIYTGTMHFELAGRIESKNTTSFNEEYLIDASSSYADIEPISVPNISLTNKAFVKLGGGRIRFYQTSQMLYYSTGVGYDVYIETGRDGDQIISDTYNTINNKLKIKYSETAFNAYANNFDKAVGKAYGYTNCKSLMQIVTYYQQTEEIGGYAFREVYDEENNNYPVYLLENIGVVFNQNIPEATILGETIRELGDTSPTTTISVPFGFAIDEDGEYSSVPSYDVYGYKKLGWSNNTNVYNSYNATNYNYAHLLDSSSNVQITHAFVGGSGQDNYGYSSSNDVVENGVTKRYIYYYARWYQFLGDSMLYDDSSTTSVFEGASVIPIYFAEEFVYLSSILCLDEATSYKGSSTQTFNNSSYAVMADLNIDSYYDYGVDSSSGDGKWTYKEPKSDVVYSPMCLTEETAFIGDYFVGAMRTNDDTNGVYLTDVLVDDEGTMVRGYRQINMANIGSIDEYLQGSLGHSPFLGVVKYSTLSNILLKNVQIGSSLANTGGFVGYAESIKMNYCYSDNVTVTSSKNNVGGLVGYMDGTCKLSFCTNASNVTGPYSVSSAGSDNGVGGIVGRIGEHATVSMEGCFNSGNIKTWSGAGGIVGVLGMTSGSDAMVTIKNSKNEGTINSNAMSAGGIAGVMFKYGIVEDCENTGNVSSENTTDGRNIGGIVGYMDCGAVKNCNNTGTVAAATTYAGGVVGREVTSGVIETCSNSGTVSVVTSTAGGVCGFFQAGSITKCSNSGPVSGKDYIAGIVADSPGDATIKGDSETYCLNSGKITATGTFVGGIAAYSTGDMEYCKNTGDVSTTLSGSDARCGGVLGIGNSLNMSYCINLGTVSCTSAPFSGGIAGALNSGGSITNCTNGESETSKRVNGYNYTGGILGYTEGGMTLTNNYNYMYIGGDKNVAGIVARGTTATITYCYNYGQIHGDYDDTAEEEYYDMYGEYAYDWSDLYIGGIAGRITGGSISNCTNNATVGRFGSYIGGIAGYSSVSISSCTNSGTINGAQYYTAGIVGYSTSSVSSCTNRGSINGAEESTGGIVGMGSGMTGLSDCTNSSNVTGTSYVGGIAGYMSSSTQIYNCITESTATIKGGMGTAGIVGYALSTNVTWCSNAGTVTGSTSGTGIMGGVAGYAYNLTVSGCSNSGTITGKGPAVGGIIGSSNKTKVSYYSSKSAKTVNSGTVSSSGNNVGGIVGNAFGSSEVGTSTSYLVENSGPVSGAESIGGIAGFLNSSTMTCGRNYGSVSGKHYVGGVCGQATSSTITGSNTYYVTVSGSGDNVGGIIGYLKGSSSAGNCINYADVTGSLNVGGITGKIENSDMYSCVTHDTTMTATTGRVGGVVGQLVCNTKVVTLNTCSTLGNVTITTPGNEAGGIIGGAFGANGYHYELRNCGVNYHIYNNVAGSGSTYITAQNQFVGVVVGYQEGSGGIYTVRMYNYIYLRGANYGVWVGYGTSPQLITTDYRSCTIYAYVNNRYVVFIEYV